MKVKVISDRLTNAHVQLQSHKYNNCTGHYIIINGQHIRTTLKVLKEIKLKTNLTIIKTKENESNSN